MKSLITLCFTLLFTLPSICLASDPVFEEMSARFKPGDKWRGFYKIKENDSMKDMWNVQGINGCRVEVDNRNDKQTFSITIFANDIYSSMSANSKDSYDPYSIKKSILVDGTIKYVATDLSNKMKTILLVKGKDIAIKSDSSYGARNKFIVCGKK